MLTAVVTGAAGVAGFPNLADEVRVLIVLGTAAIAGAIAALQGSGRRDEMRAAALRRPEAIGSERVKPDLFHMPPDIRNFVNQMDAVSTLVASATGKRASGYGPAVCVVSGKGGVGKTAVAVHVAHKVKSAFSSGLLFANLHGAEGRPLDAGQVLEEFLQELGLDPALVPPRLEDRARVYRSRLTDGRYLILLDNVADEAQVRPLLPWSPGCAVLITSRGRLAGLEGAQLVALDVLEPEAALTLLQGVIGHERLEAEVEAARSVIRMCAGLPLAVKVAGAKLASRPHWRIARLMERLQDDQSRLRELRVGDVEVRSVLGFSYDTRPDRERQVFRRLGLLRSTSFPAWAVAALVGESASETEELLETLAEAQLIEVVGEDPAGQMHYRLHDLLRDFARERADAEEAPADRAAAQRRYLEAYLAVVGEARRRLEPGAVIDPDAGADAADAGVDAVDAGAVGGADEAGRWRPPDAVVSGAVADDPVRWYSFERSNLDAVVQHAFDAGLPLLGAAVLDRLSAFFEDQAAWKSWREAAQVALTAATRAGDRRLEGQALYELGAVDRFEGHYASAIEHLRASVSMLSEVGDRGGAAKALRMLGIVLNDAGHTREAIASFEEGIELFRRLGDSRWEAQTTQELGVVQRMQGDWRQAIELLSSALAQFRRLGDRRREARALRSLADVYHEQGRFDEALEILLPVASTFEELGDRRWAATTRMRIGEIGVKQGRVDEALAVLEGVRPALRDLGDRRWEAMTVLHIGEAHVQQSRPEDALAELGAARDVFEQLGDRRFAAIATASVAGVHLGQGRLGDALAGYDQAFEVFRELGDRARLAEVRRDRGRARALDGQVPLAIEDLEQALVLFSGLDRREDVQEVEAELGRIRPA